MKNPNLIPKPFAQSGQKNDIPANHKSDQPSQKATWDTGFPQITMMPVTAGGLPPSGRDFNGILNQISDNIVHLSKGGKFKYSQEYADLIGGYPKGAILQSDDETREFQSLADNNKINFNKEPSEKVNAAWKQVSTTQILDELNKKLNRSDVVQSVGSSKTQVMSQNAVTDALNTKQDKGDYATNPALNEVRKQANTANQNAVNANDNANRRLDKAQNGADIPDKKAFVSNLGLEKTVELAANALDKRTGGTVSGAVTVGQLMTPALTIGSGGVYDGNRDAASFEGNNIEIRSWHGVGFKSTHNSPNDVTSIYFNTRNGDIAAQGSISSQGDIASQGNLSILKNASVKGKISADEGLIAGTASQNAILTPWGDLHGNTWGGWLSHWLNATFARKNSGVVSGKGWFKDESTGLIIQWGSESESNRNFSFPHMFSEACFVVLVTNSTSQGRSIDNAFGYPVNNSEFYAATKRENGIVNGFPVAWLAIGR